MTTVTLRPDGTITAPLSVTGAASSHAATNDNSDSSYFLLDVTTASYISEVSLDTVTLPAGSVTKSLRSRGRGRSVTGLTEALSQVSVLFGIPLSSSVEVLSTGIDDWFGAYAPVSLSQTDVNNLQMRVDVSNFSAGGAGRFMELYVDLVYVEQPVVAVTAVSPDPYLASNWVPISWVNTLDADGGAQTHLEIRAFSAAQYGIGGFDPATSPATWETGQQLSVDTLRFVPALANLTTYRAYVRTAQTVNGALHWSDWDYDEFDVDVDTSDIDTVVGVANDATGAIVVTVERDTGSEAWNFIEVERSIDSGATWQPVRDATYVDATADADTFVVTDYEAPNSVDTTYRARATRILSGQPITGEWVESTPEQWTSTAMFLKVPGSPSLNVSTVCLASRTPYRRSRRTGVFSVLGARLPVVISDVRSARSGVIEWETLTSAEAASIDALLEGASVVLVQFPPSMDIADMYAAFIEDEELFVSQVANVVRRNWSVSYIEVAMPPDPHAGV